MARAGRSSSRRRPPASPSPARSLIQRAAPRSGTRCASPSSVVLHGRRIFFPTKTNHFYFTVRSMPSSSRCSTRATGRRASSRSRPCSGCSRASCSGPGCRRRCPARTLTGDFIAFTMGVEDTFADIFQVLRPGRRADAPARHRPERGRRRDPYRVDSRAALGRDEQRRPVVRDGRAGRPAPPPHAQTGSAGLAVAFVFALQTGRARDDVLPPDAVEPLPETSAEGRWIRARLLAAGRPLRRVAFASERGLQAARRRVPASGSGVPRETAHMSFARKQQLRVRPARAVRDVAGGALRPRCRSTTSAPGSTVAGAMYTTAHIQPHIVLWEGHARPLGTPRLRPSSHRRTLRGRRGDADFESLRSRGVSHPAARRADQRGTSRVRAACAWRSACSSRPETAYVRATPRYFDVSNVR